MSVQIKIENVDRSNIIVLDSVRLSRAKTNSVDTLSFGIKRKTASDYAPELLNDVELIEGTETLFGGEIVSIDDTTQALLGYVTYKCKDYSHEMDRKLVATTYEDTTVEAIIEDIKDNVLTPGFTTDNVDCPLPIEFSAFNYEYPTKVIQQLADLVEYDWYVDKNKSIHFFARGSRPAPFNLDDTSGNHFYDTLTITKDISNLRNSITVRGGTFSGNERTDSQEADGEKTVFILPFKYKNISININGGADLTVGIANIHNFIDNPDKEVLYSFSEKTLEFPTPLTAGDVINVTGNPELPVIVQVNDPTSAQKYGLFEFKIIDSSIDSKTLARERARAEIKAWGDTINEGQFVTDVAGLVPGHIININSTIRDIDDDFIVSRITSTMKDAHTMKHSVTLVSNETFGIIEFLQNLLISKDKDLRLNASDVVDKVTIFFDEFNLRDTIILTELISGPFKWSTDTTTSSAPGKWGRSVWQ